MSDLESFFNNYDPVWIEQFLFSVFGKFKYIHTLSEFGLDCYLSNLRSVDKYHPDDFGCVKLYINHNLYNMVDFKDPESFLNACKTHLDLSNTTGV